MALVFATLPHTQARVCPSETAPMEEFRRAFWQISTQRRLARTRNGCLALAPASARSTDIVGFFQGSQVPYVLRKVSRDNFEKHILIGEIYVHGFMKGEINLWGARI